MKLKKIIALMLAGCMVMGLVACGSGESDKKKDEAEKKEVTAKELIELVSNGGDKDCTYNMSMELSFEYVKEYEGAYEIVMEGEYQCDEDNDITYLEQAIKSIVDIKGYDKKETETEVKQYTVDLGDDKEKTVIWDSENGKWTSETSKDDDDTDEDALAEKAELTEKGDNYILTVKATNEEFGLDITSLILGDDAKETIKCDVEMVAKIDKESLEIISYNVDFDIAAINECLDDQIFKCTKFEMIIDGYEYKDVELELPDGV